jgi:hypothetical protein
MLLNGVVYLLLTLTDWILTKIGLFAGIREGNPIVEFVGGIDNGLIVKLICWIVVMLCALKLNTYKREWGLRGVRLAILVYAITSFRNAVFLGWPLVEELWK